jgi:hypothetical protein
MTLAFMALFVAFVADRIDLRIGTYWLLPILLAAGVASVAYWDWTESLGRGDLRPYLVVQFYPILALPLIAWLFPATRYTTGRHLFWLIAWYGAAKAFEVFDAQILAMLGGLLSGHTLKHLASAIAVLVIIRMILSGSHEPQSDRSSL